jgi:hypothetical protein
MDIWIMNPKGFLPHLPMRYAWAMSELGGEILGPDEGAKAIEPLSEAAKMKFAAARAAQQTQQIKETRAKKKDDELARALLQFLNDPHFIALFRPISALVARNCPSVFLLSVISLIHTKAREEVQHYFQEELQITTAEEVVAEVLLPSAAALNADMRNELLSWITRLQMVIATDPQRIVGSFMDDARRMDDHMLDVGVFLLQEFFARHGKTGNTEKMKPLTTELLRIAIEPFEGVLGELEMEKIGMEEEDK